MTEYAEVWHLTRGRLDEVCSDLSEEQANWKPFPKSHTTLQYLYHVAGIEFYYYTILAGVTAKDDYEEKLLEAAANDFLREGVFPFSGSDMTKDKAAEALSYTGRLLGPIIENPTKEQLKGSYISAQSANIDGRGAFVRVSQHAGYHTGQIYLMRCDPEFPA